MKIKKFVSSKPDSTTLVTLVSVNGNERNMSARDHYFPEAGLYVIEEDGFTSIAESVEDFFPDADMTNKAEREEAFNDYAEMLIESDSYAPLPKRLC